MSPISWLRATAIAFAALYFGALFTAPLPEGAYDDERVVGLLSGTGLLGIVIGGYALVLAGLSALAFTSILADMLHRAVPEASGPALVRALGTAYGVLLMTASALFLAVPMGHVVEELPTATPSPFRELTMAGFTTLLVAALLCAGVLVIVASLLQRRGGLAPRWCTTTALLIAPLLLIGVGWAPQFLVPIWAILVAFTMRPEQRDRGRVQGASAASGGHPSPLGDRSAE
ncbi:hypothetical protein GA707_16945 [Nostocoides sp. F2B08]|uniref:hypothetical protein n=1 Tax=Nostocoides sp. F2B08 TaxID=2653936 RepID=UPI001262D936|nr:hypothetical protein [Tetrasphaera sp. F2B08]KAB7741900.1 hypothetical protein GA707_16945 [Tetrasphaera sp. F2B08]